MRKTFRRDRSPRHERTTYQRHRYCRYCADQNLEITYRNYNGLRSFITDRGKIIPRRISGNCAKHQRRIAKEIKRGRMVSIYPFTATTV